jgi:hypothetical protein
MQQYLVPVNRRRRRPRRNLCRRGQAVTAMIGSRREGCSGQGPRRFPLARLAHTKSECNSFNRGWCEEDRGTTIASQVIFKRCARQHEILIFKASDSIRFPGIPAHPARLSRTNKNVCGLECSPLSISFETYEKQTQSTKALSTQSPRACALAAA